MYEEKYSNGDIIFCEFEPGKDAYVVKNGRVRIAKIREEAEKTLDVIGPGGLFGEMALIENAPRSATAIAADDETVLMRFDKSNFEILLKTQPQVAVNLLKTLAKRIFDAKRRLRILSFKDPEARVLDAILMLAEWQGVNPEASTSVEIPSTAEDVAHWCGLPIREVENIFYRLNNMGRIEIYTDKIVVKNIGDISRLVETKLKIRSEKS